MEQSLSENISKTVVSRVSNLSIFLLRAAGVSGLFRAQYNLSLVNNGETDGIF